MEKIKQTLATLPEQRTPTQKDRSALSSNGKQWQAQLDEHIAYMQHLRERIDGCISCGCLSMNKCPTCNKDDHLG
ncbi:MAG TPA: redox-sensitive transcriptional activator SoxR, partial [Pseudoalteromonas sp.]|nr:redox-sensitive transcriptional activator SoxR [Pseudoalteromonas sp.]